MEVRYHFFAGVILSVILLPFFGVESFAVLLPSVLLDIDHYLIFIVKNRKFNLKECNVYHKNNCGKHSLCIFHTIEFLGLLCGVE